jgi:hypothetical protein
MSHSTAGCGACTEFPITKCDDDAAGAQDERSDDSLRQARQATQAKQKRATSFDILFLWTKSLRHCIILPYPASVVTLRVCRHTSSATAAGIRYPHREFRGNLPGAQSQQQSTEHQLRWGSMRYALKLERASEHIEDNQRDCRSLRYVADTARLDCGNLDRESAASSATRLQNR